MFKSPSGVSRARMGKQVIGGWKRDERRDDRKTNGWSGEKDRKTEVESWAWENRLHWAEADQRLIRRFRACKNTSLPWHAHTLTHTYTLDCPCANLFRRVCFSSPDTPFCVYCQHATLYGGSWLCHVCITLSKGVKASTPTVCRLKPVWCR